MARRFWWEGALHAICSLLQNWRLGGAPVLCEISRRVLLHSANAAAIVEIGMLHERAHCRPGA
jgi:hypothetical protein